MRVIPAIDLQDGRCVRLYQGRFDAVTEYSSDPASIAREFATFDVSELHVVDLDGARTGEQANTDAIRQISKSTDLRIQLGGGLRYTAVVEHWFANGVQRCVVGSAAVQEPDKVKRWIRHFGADRIVLALDVKLAADGTPLLATEGWTKTSTRSLWECLDDFATAGTKHVLCTDVSRDGAMTGPNLRLYADIVHRYPDIVLQASGGIRSRADLLALRERGVASAISGRALLEGTLTGEEVRAFRQGA